MSRLEAWKTFAAFMAVPLMFFAAAVFDPGVAGQLMRTAIQLAVE